MTITTPRRPSPAEQAFATEALEAELADVNARGEVVMRRLAEIDVEQARLRQQRVEYMRTRDELKARASQLELTLDALRAAEPIGYTLTDTAWLAVAS